MSANSSGANLPPRNQAPFTLGEIARITRGVLHGDANTEICGIITDTRLLESNSENTPASTCRPLFVALRGANFDGHRFVSHALRTGAGAALVETADENSQPCVRVENTQIALGELARFQRQRFDIPVVGVTGSYGKTTTRALIAQALRAKNVWQTTGNFNNEIGVPLTLLALDESHGAAVIEMGMRGRGEIDYLANIARPTVGIITNIGPQHIELLGSEENIARTKAELLAHLPSNGTAILPRDDAWFDVLKELAPCEILSFGTREDADFRVGNYRATEIGGAFDVTFDAQTVEVNLPLPGLHNAINAAGALACASTCDVDLESAAQSLREVEIPGARMRIVKANGLTIIDDCYNAGPNSMRAALQVLADTPDASRRVAILGAMRELGDWTASEHRKIGAFVAQIGVQVLVGVGDETKNLIAAARENNADCVFAWAPNAEDAAQIARDLVRENDVVLVKGSRSIGLEKVVNALDGS